MFILIYMLAQRITIKWSSCNCVLNSHPILVICSLAAASLGQIINCGLFLQQKAKINIIEDMKLFLSLL